MNGKVKKESQADQDQENAVFGCGIYNFTPNTRKELYVGYWQSARTESVDKRSVHALERFSGPNVLPKLGKNFQRNSYQRTTFSRGTEMVLSLTPEGKKMSLIQHLLLYQIYSTSIIIDKSNSKIIQVLFLTKNNKRSSNNKGSLLEQQQSTGNFVYKRFLLNRRQQTSPTSILAAN